MATFTLNAPNYQIIGKGDVICSTEDCGRKLTFSIALKIIAKGEDETANSIPSVNAITCPSCKQIKTVSAPELRVVIVDLKAEPEYS